MSTKIEVMGVKDKITKNGKIRYILSEADDESGIKGTIYVDPEFVSKKPKKEIKVVVSY